ncbi:Establishment of cohesion 1, partial [Dimargaris verticillata]
MLSTDSALVASRSPVKITYQRRKHRSSTNGESVKNPPTSSAPKACSRTLGNPPTPRTKRQRSVPLIDPVATPASKLRQLHLDFGQKHQGPTQCLICGLEYQCGQTEDEALHDRYHRSVVRGIRYP